MADAGFFRGTNADQDNRFSDKEKKLLKTMKYEESILTKIDWSKIRMEVLKPWITKRVTQLLGMDDDVVTEFIFNQLDEKNVDPRKMQINLTGFLNGKNARTFMGELWSMLDSAQKSERGIPQELLDQKKEEMKSRDDDNARLQEKLQRIADGPDGQGGGQDQGGQGDNDSGGGGGGAGSRARSRSRSRSRDRGSRRRRSRDRGRRSRSRSRDRRRSRRSSRSRSRSRSPGRGGGDRPSSTKRKFTEDAEPGAAAAVKEEVKDEPREEGDPEGVAAAADSASEAANPDSAAAVKKEPSAERNVLPDSTEDAVGAKPKVEGNEGAAGEDVDDSKDATEKQAPSEEKKDGEGDEGEEAKKASEDTEDSKKDDEAEKKKGDEEGGEGAAAARRRGSRSRSRSRGRGGSRRSRSSSGSRSRSRSRSGDRRKSDSVQRKRHYRSAWYQAELLTIVHLVD